MVEKDLKFYHQQSVYLDMMQKNVYEAYKTCSTAKMKVWESWREWFCDMTGETGYNVPNMWVCSHNSSFFSIGGKITTLKGKKYGVKITPTHNYIWELL